MHYANGREAKVGDHVVGTAYNTSGHVAGVLVGVTPGSDTCNARVLFIKPYQYEGSAPIAGYMHFEGGAIGNLASASTPTVPLAGVCFTFKLDYTDCGSLLHAEDAFELVKIGLSNGSIKTVSATLTNAK